MFDAYAHPLLYASNYASRFDVLSNILVISDQKQAHGYIHVVCHAALLSLLHRNNGACFSIKSGQFIKFSK